MKLDKTHGKMARIENTSLFSFLNSDTHHSCAVIVTLNIVGDWKRRLYGFVTGVPGCV